METDKSTSKEEKAIKAAAGVVLGPQYHLRSEKIYNTSDEKFSIDEIGQIKWDNAAIGKLKMGSTILTPSIIPIVDVEAGPKIVEKLQRRLDHFIQRTIENQFEPLLKMKEDHNLVVYPRDCF